MKIMLDAGHGYNTPGKRSPDVTMKEYEFNRAVAAYAKAGLEQYENTTVYFAHSDDGDIPLVTRTNRANELKVDCYVSIHANAFGNEGWNSASGIETYVYPTKPKVATELANRIQKGLVLVSGLPNRGVKTADFHVLRETEMDAVLVECGFMTNANDVKLLKSDDYRRKVAGVIVEALAAQYDLRKKSVVKPLVVSKEIYAVQVFAGSKEGAKKALEKAKKVFPDAYLYKK